MYICVYDARVPNTKNSGYIHTSDSKPNIVESPADHMYTV